MFSDKSSIAYFTKELPYSIIPLEVVEGYAPIPRFANNKQAAAFKPIPQ